jgi:hypothetical protein
VFTSADIQIAAFDQAAVADGDYLAVIDGVEVLARSVVSWMRAIPGAARWPCIRDVNG